MATSKTFGQLARRMNFRAKKFGVNAETAVRRAALAADNVLVTTTPFDTGRARGNWITAVGSPDTQVVAVAGPGSGAAALDQGKAVIGKWRLGAGTIYITNNLAYIIPLDEGSSQQAPNGMSQLAMQAARRELKKARLLK